MCEVNRVGRTIKNFELVYFAFGRLWILVINEVPTWWGK